MCCTEQGSTGLRLFWVLFSLAIQHSKEVCQEEREAVITNTLTRGHAFVLSTLRDCAVNNLMYGPYPAAVCCTPGTSSVCM
jgi:hypothetical protein